MSSQLPATSSIGSFVILFVCFEKIYDDSRFIIVSLTISAHLIVRDAYIFYCIISEHSETSISTSLFTSRNFEDNW